MNEITLETRKRLYEERLQSTRSEIARLSQIVAQLQAQEHQLIGALAVTAELLAANAAETRPQDDEDDSGNVASIAEHQERKEAAA